MNQDQQIKIDKSDFRVVKTYSNYRIEDSFIHRSNKLREYSGNGEAKKHVGTYSGENGKALSEFYEYKNWGTPHKDSSGKKTINSAIQNNALISAQCFFTKSNLLKYLETAKTEYTKQEQVYHNNIQKYYDERIDEVKRLPKEVIYFSIYDASDNLDKPQSRGYIRSDDEIWGIWRKLVLPKISYLSISKLEMSNGEKRPFFYFKLFLDYNFREFNHPWNTIKEEQDVTSSTEKNKKEEFYFDGGSFKRAVHEHMPQCPFSKISDERLLTASHIKPKAFCLKNNLLDEAADHLNGLSLSPTYDRLFDKGYITFTDEGNLVCGTEISSYSWSKLNINPSIFSKYNILPDGRENYLSYHREHVFLGNFEELYF